MNWCPLTEEKAKQAALCVCVHYLDHQQQYLTATSDVRACMSAQQKCYVTATTMRSPAIYAL